MRKLFAPLAIACLAVLAATVLFAGTPANQAPTDVTIDDCVSKKSAVAFPHGAHMERLECKTCHHAQEGLTKDSTDTVQTCGECHTEPADAATPVCSQMSMKSNPFHLTCVTCHKEELAKNAESKAPTKCDQCHPKA